MEHTTEKLKLVLPLSHFSIIESTDSLLESVFFDDIRKMYSLTPLHNYFLYKENSFSRAHAEQLLAQVRQTPKDNTDRFFILDIDKITPEASNMLLKSFEETNEQNHFVIIIPKKEYLPATLYSRAIFYGPFAGLDTDVQIFFDAFINGSKSNRLQLVENFLVRYENEDLKKKLISDIRFFFDKLELWLSSQSSFEKKTIGPLVYKSKEYLVYDNASVKMILEMCALVIT